MIWRKKRVWGWVFVSLRLLFMWSVKLFTVDEGRAECNDCVCFTPKQRQTYKQIPFAVTVDLTSFFQSLPLQSKHWCKRCWSSNMAVLCKIYYAFIKRARLSGLYVVLLVFAPYVKFQDPKQVVVWGNQLCGETYSALAERNDIDNQIVAVICG